jgi:thioredoxin reductase (NADPH)
MSHPILFLVDDRPKVAAALAGDLERRFGRDHRVLTETSPAAPLEALTELAARDEEVALVVVGQKMAELPGVVLLLRAHELHPSAKRVLLAGRRDWTPTNWLCGP